MFHPRSSRPCSSEANLSIDISAVQIKRDKFGPSANPCDALLSLFRHSHAGALRRYFSVSATQQNAPDFVAHPDGEPAS
jgi:hypothetical protein